MEFTKLAKKFRSELIDETIEINGGDWDILIDIGGRSTGKSTSWRMYLIKECFKTGAKMCYIGRRETTDIKPQMIEFYFNSKNDIEKLTDGKYNYISAFRGSIFFSRIDDTGHITRGSVLGYYASLSKSGKYKTTLRDKGVKFAVYEEFIPENGIYLDDEPNILLGLLATLFGTNNTGRCILIGNTISRVNPYYRAWGLQGIRKQKPNTYDLYNIETDDSLVKVLVTYIQPTEQDKFQFTIGKKGKQINGECYEVRNYPRLKKDMLEDYILFECNILFEDFSFICQLRTREDSTQYCFIYPSNRFTKRILTHKFSINPNTSFVFNPEKPLEVMMQKLLALGKVLFSDNLTGQDFFDCLINNPFIQVPLLEYDENYDIDF